MKPPEVFEVKKHKSAEWIRQRFHVHGTNNIYVHFSPNIAILVVPNGTLSQKLQCIDGVQVDRENSTAGLTYLKLIEDNKDSVYRKITKALNMQEIFVNTFN